MCTHSIQTILIPFQGMIRVRNTSKITLTMGSIFLLLIKLKLQEVFAQYPAQTILIASQVDLRASLRPKTRFKII